MSAALGGPSGGNNIVVIDNGTGFLKAGFAADNLPRYTIPSIVGRPVLRAEEEAIGDIDFKDIMVGDEAAAYRSGLEISYPLENGIIKKWDDMEHVWSYLFNEKMHIDTKDHRVLLTEAPLNPRENRIKMAEVMFEKYGFQAMQVGIQATLTLFAQGLMSGLVLDSGDGVTHVVVVSDNYAIPHLTSRLNVAGRHITRHLIKLMMLRGYTFNRTSDFQTAQEIKEKLCYVAMEPEKERRLAHDTTVLMEKYKLPDGREIKIGQERFEAPEALFTPSVADVESPGIADMVFETIQKADMDIRMSLYRNIVLSGGTTMYRGLPSRLDADIRSRYLKEVLKNDEARLKKFKLHIEDPPRRKHMVFLGGSVLGDIMANSTEYWMWKADYAEKGAARMIDEMCYGSRKPAATGGSKTGALSR